MEGVPEFQPTLDAGVSSPVLSSFPLFGSMKVLIKRLRFSFRKYMYHVLNQGGR